VATSCRRGPDLKHKVSTQTAQININQSIRGSDHRPDRDSTVGGQLPTPATPRRRVPIETSDGPEMVSDLQGLHSGLILENWTKSGKGKPALGSSAPTSWMIPAERSRTPMTLDFENKRCAAATALRGLRQEMRGSRMVQEGPPRPGRKKSCRRWSIPRRRSRRGRLRHRQRP